MNTLEQAPKIQIIETDLERVLRLQTQLGHLTLFELEHPFIFRAVE